MKVFAMVLALLLAGCVNPAVKQLNDWGVVEEARAVRGEIQWSYYYTEMYSRVANLPNMDLKTELMESTNSLISAAKSYESGAMSKQDFQNRQRSAQIEWQKTVQAHRAAASQAMVQGVGQAFQTFGNAIQTPPQQMPAYQPPRQTTCSTYGNQTYCTTQ